MAANKFRTGGTVTCTQSKNAPAGKGRLSAKSNTPKKNSQHATLRASVIGHFSPAPNFKYSNVATADAGTNPRIQMAIKKPTIQKTMETVLWRSTMGSISGSISAKDISPTFTWRVDAKASLANT